MQATPDLMPADILGTSILQAAGAQMIFRPRAGLHRLSAGGRDQPDAAAYPVRAAGVHGGAPGDHGHGAASAAEVFTVFATQNPIDFEGTYPLPEAQLDRFLMKIRVGYPTVEQERLVLERHHAGFDQPATPS